MTFRIVKLLGFLHRLEFSVPEMQKYVFVTLYFGRSKKAKESEMQSTVFSNPLILNGITVHFLKNCS